MIFVISDTHLGLVNTFGPENISGISIAIKIVTIVSVRDTCYADPDACATKTVQKINKGQRRVTTFRCH